MILDLEHKNIIELQNLYSNCEKGEEFFTTIAGQIIIEKLITSREEQVSLLETCKIEDLIIIQCQIKAIDSIAGFITQFAQDKELIREEIENKKK